MEIWLAFLFVFVATIDVLIIGMSYSLKNININLWFNILIGIISGFGTYLSMLAGNYLSLFVNLKFTNILAGSILLILGIKMFKDIFDNNNNSNTIECLKENPEIIDINKSGTIEIFEVCILALALTINNVGVGISASLAGINIYLITGLSIISSVLFLFIGQFIGRVFYKGSISHYLEIISSIIILVLGAILVLI